MWKIGRAISATGSVHIGQVRLANRSPINLSDPDPLLVRVVDFPLSLDVFIVKGDLQTLLKRHPKPSKVERRADAVQPETSPESALLKSA